jgi:tetratricopeptide (TPR) repeat protein
MDFTGSEESLAKAKSLEPGYPYVYFGQANLSWLRYVYESQQTDETLKNKFEREVGEAVAASESWLKKHPKDAKGYLALSGAYGLRARLSTIEKRWIRALMDGRKAVKFTRKAHDLDPRLHDALLGAGMYDYYSDSLPRAVKILGKLVLGGNRERGIASLKTVAEKGTYAKIAAKLMLIEIYTEDESGPRNPAEALRIIQDLKSEFPQSPVFHKIEHVCLYEAKRFQELRKSVADYKARIVEGKAYYPERDRARMFVTEGTADFAENKLEAAQEAFQRAADLSGTEKKPDRWGVWGLIRLGQVYDALNLRAKAVEAYRTAARFPDIWDFRNIAESGLKKPILLGLSVGQLPPP